eukprot:TRINITY_DN7988_c0_g2_i1.p1 TRINITY_DN7988_c0_g2~~TRINITY_DN7988_c0_g2_i1.p1  ORF type:complete len:511 (-),score=108.89 TRINITY_DN7988_c0_g2_i1:1572-3104(-)
MYQPHAFTLNTPIDRVFLALTRRMGLDERFDYKMDKWLKVLKENWICTFGGILRAPPGTFERLGLPIALADELKRIQALPNQYMSANFFAVQEGGKNTWHNTISDLHKELVLHSFSCLVQFKSETGVGGQQLFEESFFTYLLGQAISVQRLYGYGNSHVAGRSFWKMLFWVIENIDNLEISEELVRIGGCHSIYGVTEEEYKAFASSLCNCIKDIIGEKHFGIETVEAWHAVFNCISDLMIKVGETTKQGFKGELRRFRENSTWGTKYITLMPETIYLYKDYERTDLYGQFPLRDITIQDHNDVPYSFKLSSFDPPFLLTLAALDEKQYNKWLIEIDWRVTALHHLYKDHDSEGMSHCDDLGETGQKESGMLAITTQQKITTKHQRHLKKNRLQLSPQELVEKLDKSLAKGIPASEVEKEIMKKSWLYLTTKKFVDSDGLSKSGLGKLFEEFYAKFLHNDHVGKRLFEGVGIKVQGRALVTIVGLIVRSLDDWNAFTSQIRRLGFFFSFF